MNNTENRYVAFSVQLHSISIYRDIYLSAVFPSAVHSTFLSHFSFFKSISRPIICTLIFSICFLPHYVSFHRIFKSVLGDDSDQAAKDCGLILDTSVTLYKNQGWGRKVLRSAIIPGVGSTDSDEFQCCIHGVNLNCWSASDLIVMKAVVLHRNSFCIPCLYEFGCASMDKVSKPLTDKSKYGFYVWDSHESGWQQKQRVLIKEYIWIRPKGRKRTRYRSHEGLTRHRDQQGGCYVC